MTGTSQPR
ncbi:hypothetical protein HaLaN_32369, partial [Haematococcus lacustris]